MSKPPILCVDFDGVLHSYTSGWKGASVIPDPPVPGAIAFLREAVKYFRVMIFSTRSQQDGGIIAMREWLGQHVPAEEDWLVAIEWPTEKPPALVTLDDRAITFTGTWPAMDELLMFTPWNRRR